MLNIISKYRGALMALAILGVLLTHSDIRIKEPMLYFLNYWIVWGQGGVDLFFFLSGFGLYYSCCKDDSCLPFWRKRLWRIIPPYLISLAVWIVAKHSNTPWTEFWHHAIFIGYWFPQLGWHYFSWFVSAIMMLYLVYPFYFKAFKRWPLWSTIVAALVGVALGGLYSYYFLVLHPKGVNAFIHFCTRIPVFFVGTYVGWLAHREKEGTFTLGRRGVATMLALAVVGYVALRWVGTLSGWPYRVQRNSGLLFYPFLLIVPGFSLAFGYVFSRMPKWLLQTASIVGKSTLEIYLLMATVLLYKADLVKWAGGSDAWGGLALVVICIVAGLLMHYVLMPLVYKTLKLIAAALRWLDDKSRGRIRRWCRGRREQSC